MKRLITLTVLFYAVIHSFSQTPDVDSEGSLVKWMSLSEAMEKTKAAPRPIIIDFYTDWCGWCKKMMKTTYANPVLSQYINSNFYPVKFNAETSDTVEYLGNKYGPGQGTTRVAHTLAIKLLQGKMMYPTTLFLNNYDKQKNEFTFSMIAQGYLEIKKLEPILVFQLENVFRNSNFEDFQDMYNKAFYDSGSVELSEKLTWLKPSEYFRDRDTSNKKTMVFIHTEWCNACRVMQRASLQDRSLAEYLSEKYELVDFNPEITEQLSFRGQTFSNLQSAQAPFHQLASALSRNNLVLPTLVVLDEKMNLLDAIPYYLNPEILKVIAIYYGDDNYKTRSWTDFRNGVSSSKGAKN